MNLTSNRYLYALFLHLFRYPRSSDAGNAAGRAARYPSTDLMDAWKDLVQHRGTKEAGRHSFVGEAVAYRHTAADRAVIGLRVGSREHWPSSTNHALRKQNLGSFIYLAKK